MKKYDVIIVEDDPMVAAINRQYLQSNPELSIVGEFRNGHDAILFLEKHPVDLAVIDYYMPIMDGREFILNCRKRQFPVNIIMITAANHVHEISEILQMGIVDYLVKPFTFERFQTGIQKYLNLKKILRPDVQLSQTELDKIMSPTLSKTTGPLLEKGLQDQTLTLIQHYLSEHPDQYLSSNEIAGHVGLSRITVRRYMNYLLENHEIISQVDYSTGGRPSIKYKKI